MDRPPDRCRAAGLDPDTAFATKSELAARMITRFLDSGVHIALPSTAPGHRTC